MDNAVPRISLSLVVYFLILLFILFVLPIPHRDIAKPSDPNIQSFPLQLLRVAFDSGARLILRRDRAALDTRLDSFIPTVKKSKKPQSSRLAHKYIEEVRSDKKEEKVNKKET